MVNINVFGGLNKDKKEMADEKKIATVFVTNKDGMDVESALLVENGRCRRGKFACLTCVADLCALAVIILIILCTSLLLMRLWWVKKEVDQMEPTVQRVMEDIVRLRQQADSIQAENRALLGVASYQKESDTDKDSFPMEDTSREALIILSSGDNSDSIIGNSDEDKIRNNMLMMMIMASLKNDLEGTTPATETANLTSELLTLQSAQSSLLDYTDPLPRFEPTLDTGNDWQTMDLKKIGIIDDADDDESSDYAEEDTTKNPDSDSDSDDEPDSQDYPSSSKA